MPLGSVVETSCNHGLLFIFRKKGKPFELRYAPNWMNGHHAFLCEQETDGFKFQISFPFEESNVPAKIF